MSLKIYNVLTRKKEDFIPLHEGKVGMYICGPTVYGPTHLGHGRTYTNFDVVYRYLMHKGYNVKYVQNITDVGHIVGDADMGEDKIQRQAMKENVDPYAIAYKYECSYFDTMHELNNLRPTISCRATGFIMEMQDMIQTLIEKGFAYVTELGNVYFSVKKFAGYGKLSNRTLDNTVSGTRIELADDKKEPEDFALWKHAEKEHLMRWKSPWGEGYPGWHIECSTMSKKFLGDTIDIHGGGMDNMFPHHESEIAQSECANGCQFVRYFMHNNLLTVDGTKMGKSLGNFITLEDIYKKYSPMAVRWFILSFHYRAPLDFNDNGLKLSSEQYEKLNIAVKEMKKIVGEQTLSSDKVKDQNVRDLEKQFLEAMDDDFNTTVAISLVLKMTKAINTAVNNNDIETLKGWNNLVKVLCENILGFVFENNDKNIEPEIPEDIIELVEKRILAKKNKDYQTADLLRNQVMEKGYLIIDKATEKGYEIKKK